MHLFLVDKGNTGFLGYVLHLRRVSVIKEWCSDLCVWNISYLTKVSKYVSGVI
jgi:hypothetical protein